MKTYKSITIGIIAVGAVLMGLIILVALNSKAPENQTASILSNLTMASDWMKGGTDAKVSLVEYGDFQCPACGLYYPLVGQLMSEFGDKIQFVYREFPLRTVHEHAELAARAAEAAGKQGKFWEMYAKLFENQKSWAIVSLNAEKTFTDYAGSIGLDVNQFKTDLNSESVVRKIESDYQSGLDSGVNSTPSFFLNGKKVQNPANYDAFKSLITQALTQGS